MKSKNAKMGLLTLIVMVGLYMIYSRLMKKEMYTTLKNKELEISPIIMGDETPREDLYVDNDLFTGDELRPEDVVYIKSNYSYDRVLFPKLKLISKTHVGYVCMINGYIPDSIKLYELQMKDEVRDKMYIRYSITDDVGRMSFSSLYESDNPLKEEYYVYFNNGKQYQVMSMNPNIKPKDCLQKGISR